jgi:hypothetical protein
MNVTEIAEAIRRVAVVEAGAVVEVAGAVDPTTDHRNARLSRATKNLMNPLK